MNLRKPDYDGYNGIMAAFGLSRLGRKLDSAKVNFGIIGFGSHAQRVMLKALEEAKLSTLIAIGTSSDRRARDLSEEYPEIDIYPSYESLLDSPDIHAVYIGLPNHLHALWSVKSLVAGKHVLCDKPLALTTAEAEDVARAAEKHQRKVLEGFVHRFHSQHREVKKLINSKVIGEVRQFEGHLHYFFDDLQNIRLKADCGGGGLYDVGCYTVDCARFVLEREPRNVFGTWKIGDNSGVDESASFQLNFGDGVCAQLTFGCTFGSANWYRVYGTKGMIEVQDAFHIPRTKSPVITVDAIGQKCQQLKLPPCNQFVEEIDSFCKWINNLPVDESAFGNGLQNARILDAMKRAATLGQSQIVG